MADPSPEVVAAALALAEADSAWYDGTEGEPEEGWCSTSKAHFLALKRYRAAIAPKLRTRAERDAEIVRVVLEKRPKFPWLTQELADDLQRLCNEQTAPEPEADSDTESLRAKLKAVREVCSKMQLELLALASSSASPWRGVNRRFAELMDVLR